MEKEKSYIGYDYKNVTVKKEMEPILVDGYKNFGWKLEKSSPKVKKPVWGPLRVMLAPLALLPGTPFSKMLHEHKSETEVDIYLKRNKNTVSKNELNRLQIQYEKVLDDIIKTEDSKTTGARSIAYIVGMFGTVFMTLSVFGYLGANLQLCIILAVPGFLGWILSAVVYKMIKDKRSKNLNPIIEEKYNSANQVCEQAYALI